MRNFISFEKVISILKNITQETIQCSKLRLCVFSRKTQGMN